MDNLNPDDMKQLLQEIMDVVNKYDGQRLSDKAGTIPKGGLPKQEGEPDGDEASIAVADDASEDPDKVRLRRMSLMASK